MTKTLVKVFGSPGGERIGSGVVVFNGYVVIYTDVSEFKLTMDLQPVSVTVTRGSDTVTRNGKLSVQEHSGGTIRFVGVMLERPDSGPVDDPGTDPGDTAARVKRMKERIDGWRKHPALDDDTDGDDKPPLGPVHWVCQVVFRGRC